EAFFGSPRTCSYSLAIAYERRPRRMGSHGHARSSTSQRSISASGEREASELGALAAASGAARGGGGRVPTEERDAAALGWARLGVPLADGAAAVPGLDARGIDPRGMGADRVARGLAALGGVERVLA